MQIDTATNKKDQEDLIQVKESDILCIEHEFVCIELPLIADGLAAHS